MRHALTIEEAKRALVEAGAEQAWPYFEQEKDTTLVSFGFSTQSSFPTPAGGFADGKVTSVSPFVVVFDDFLTDEECEFLRAFAHARLAPSTVVSTDNFYFTSTETRNSEQHSLTPQQEKAVPVLRHVLKRMHRASRIPDGHAEALQISRYNKSAKYEGHRDSDPARKLARPATLIAYLNDPEGGGDTLFPVGRKDCGAVWHSDPATGEKVYGAALCCASPEKDLPETVRVTPKKGRAVLFFNHGPDGVLDRRSKHIGCPVTAGEKWIAQRWFRFSPYNRVSYSSGPGFDPRFDGAPADFADDAAAPQVAARDAAQDGAARSTRKLKDDGPRLFLVERFLQAADIAVLRRASAAAGVGDRLQEAWFSSREIAADADLDRLVQRARVVVRLPPSANASAALRFRRSRAGEGGAEPVHRDSPPSGPRGWWRGAAAAVPAALVGHVAAPEEGGDFAFPASAACGAPAGCARDRDAASCCGAAGALRVPPRAGDALLIYAHNADGSIDPASEHLVCPVLRGESLVAEFMFVYDPWRPVSFDDGARPEVQTEIVFKNEGDVDVSIVWVPPHGGKESPMGHVAPGKTFSLDTFPTHVFKVTDPVGSVLSVAKVTGAGVHEHIIQATATKLEM